MKCSNNKSEGIVPDIEGGGIASTFQVESSTTTTANRTTTSDVSDSNNIRIPISEQCAICMENIQDDEIVADESMFINCAHAGNHHAECLQRWMSYQHHCTMCRKPLISQTTTAGKRHR